MDIPSSKPSADSSASAPALGPQASPSTSPSASHLALRLENLATNARPDASPLRKAKNREDAQRRVENLERLGDSHTGDWEKGRAGVTLGGPSAASTSKAVLVTPSASPGLPCSLADLLSLNPFPSLSSFIRSRPAGCYSPRLATASREPE